MNSWKSALQGFKWNRVNLVPTLSRQLGMLMAYDSKTEQVL